MEPTSIDHPVHCCAKDIAVLQDLRIVTNIEVGRVPCAEGCVR